MKTDVIIIGAGLSGLLLARSLKRENIILEKSRGVGGRIATRRIDDQGFDHGAPFLKDDPIVQELLNKFQIPFKTSTSGLSIEGPMTKIPKLIAEGLNIQKMSRAEIIVKEENGWMIKTDSGDEYHCKDLVITAPLPQALELLKKNNIQYLQELDHLHYSKAVMALIVTYSGELPEKPVNENIHSVLSMNQRKLHPRGHIIRASEKLSDELYDCNDQTILESLLKGYSFEQNVEHLEVKKWKYVLPQTSLPYPFLEVQNHLYLTGDAFLYPDVRGSILGAKALGEKLSHT